jgi:hypothetical protein
MAARLLQDAGMVIGEASDGLEGVAQADALSPTLSSWTGACPIWMVSSGETGGAGRSRSLVDVGPV